MVAEVGEQLGNPEEGESQPLETATKQQQTKNISLCATVIFKVQLRIVC
jgi:hypothetical protein